MVTDNCIPKSSKIKQTCAICGTEFYVRASIVRKDIGKYCSNECKHKATTLRYKKTTPRFTCQNCGNEFSVSPSIAKRGNVKYCSRACYAHARKTDTTVDRKLTSLDCVNCGKKYTIPISRLKASDSKYCSRECQGAHRRTISTKTCPNCGKQYRTSKKYCSRSCYLEYLKSDEYKKSHRDKTIDRTCECCGKKFTVTLAVVLLGQGRYCSRKCFSVMKIKTMGDHYHVRGVSGKREDLNNRYFRSRWEANFARYLNFMLGLGKIRDWKYEKKTFVFPDKIDGVYAYTPDFRVEYPDGSHVWYEIKGYMDSRAALKLKLMQLHYPEEVVILFREKQYNELTEKYGWLDHWEYKT